MEHRRISFVLALLRSWDTKSHSINILSNSALISPSPSKILKILPSDGFNFRVAFPVMIGNVLLTTAYLMVAHVLFQWH